MLAFLAVTAVAPAAAAQQTTSLNITSPHPQTIVVEPVGKENQSSVCITPCNLTVEPGPLYLKAQAPGIRRYAGTIVVPPEGERLQLRAPSKKAYVWSVILMSFGGAVMLSSGMMLSQVLMGASLDDGYNQMWFAFHAHTFATGVATLTGGYFMYRANRPGLEN